MKNKFSWIIFGALMILTAVVTPSYAEADTEYFTLSEFVERSIKDNAELVRMEKEIDILKKELETINNKNLKRSKAHYNADDYVAVYMDLEFSPYSKRQEITKAERDLEQRKKTLEKSFEKMFFSYQDAQNELIAQKKVFDEFDKGLTVKREKYEKGLITALELKQYELMALELSNAYDQKLRHVELLEKQLKMAVKAPEDQKLVLKNSKKSVLKEELLNLSQFDINKNIKVVEAKENYDLMLYKLSVYERHMYNSQPQLDIRANHYNEPTDYKTVVKDVAKALEVYEKAKRDIWIDAKIASNDCLKSSSNVLILTLQHEKAKLSYDAATVKFNLGLITESEKDDAYYALLQAFYAKRDAERELYYKWFDFQGNFF